MEWIRVNRNLRNHPKTKRAAKALGISRPNLMGYLFCLWDWCVDFAPDGDLCRYSAEDIAEAAEWEGDPAAFVRALVDCGPGDSSGFLEDDSVGWQVHDWAEYTEKLLKLSQKAAQRSRQWRQNQKDKKSQPVANAYGAHTVRDANDATDGRTDVTEKTDGDTSSVEPPDTPPPDLAGQDGEGRDQADTARHEPGESTPRDQSGQAAAPPTKSIPELVMDHYNERFADKWARPLALTKGRAKKIRARLDKYSVEDLSKAIDNIRGSPFHCGEDEKSGGQVYATPDFLFRSDEMVDRWLKFKPIPKRQPPGPKADDKRRKLLASVYEG